MGEGYGPPLATLLNHGQKYACILQPFLLWERYLAVRPNGQHFRYCAVYCITSIIQHESFLNKIVKNFEEQVEDFFNVTSESLVKKLGHPA